MKKIETIEDVRLLLESAKSVLRKHRAFISGLQQTLAKSITELETVDAPKKSNTVQREPMDPAKLQKLEQRWDELQELYMTRKNIESALIALQDPKFKITKNYAATLAQLQATILEIKTSIEDTKRVLRRVSSGLVPQPLKTLANKVLNQVRATISAQNYTLTTTAHPSPKNDMFNFYALIELNDVVVSSKLYPEYFIVIVCSDDQSIWSVGTTTRVEDVGQIRGLRTVSTSGKPSVKDVFKRLNTLMHFDDLSPLSNLPLRGKIGDKLPAQFSKALYIDEQLWLLLKDKLPPKQLEDGTTNPDYTQRLKELREATYKLVYNTFGITKRLSIRVTLSTVEFSGKKKRAIKVDVTDLGFRQFSLEKIEQIGELLELEKEQINELKKIVL